MSTLDTQSQILIIEPDESIASEYQNWLPDQYDIRLAQTGAEGLNILDSARIDILLLNNTRVGLSGEDILESIEAREYSCQVILIADEVPSFDIVESGFDSYITQPLSETELRDEIRESLDRAEYEEQLNELFTLSEKKAQIEATTPEAELQQNSRYNELSERINEIEQQIDSTLGDFDKGGFEAAIERTQAIAAQRESEQRYRSLTEDVLDTSRVGTVILDDSLEVIWANSQLEEYMQIPQDSLVGQSYAKVVNEYYTSIFADDYTVEQIRHACRANNSIERFECHIEETPIRDERWLEHWSKPIRTGLYAGGRVERYYDITAQKRRSSLLESLHATTRELIQAEYKDNIISDLIEALDPVLGISSAVFYTWNDDVGELRLSETTEGISNNIEDDVPDEDNIAWQTFVQREEITTSGEGDSYLTKPIEANRVLAVPAGSHGVVVLGAHQDGSVDQVDLDLARLLITNATAALDRADREQRLRDRDEQLAEQNTQLQRLDRINTIIRKIDQTLVSASSRAEVETEVCSLLSQVGSYSLVWFGRPNPVNEEIIPETSAGDDAGYLTEAGFTFGDASDNRSLSQETISVENHIAEGAADAAWRRAALNRGYRAVLSVPVTYEQAVYGVLEVYADEPAAYTENEQNVLRELGDTLGYAIHSLEQREALLADNQIEIELEVQGSQGPLFGLSQHISSGLSVTDILPTGDSGHLVFFTVEDSAVSDFKQFAAQSPAVDDTSAVFTEATETKVRSRVRSPSILDYLTDQHASIETAEIEDGTMTLNVRVPHSTDVRSLVETLQSNYAAVELLARREQPREENTMQPLDEQIANDLTERQYECLKLAHEAGFYDWPRESDSSEIAEMLDISQPTLTQHLRKAEQKLVDHLFSL